MHEFREIPSLALTEIKICSDKEKLYYWIYSKFWLKQRHNWNQCLDVLI